MTYVLEHRRPPLPELFILEDCSPVALNRSQWQCDIRDKLSGAWATITELMDNHKVYVGPVYCNDGRNASGTCSTTPPLSTKVANAVTEAMTNRQPYAAESIFVGSCYQTGSTSWQCVVTVGVTGGQATVNVSVSGSRIYVGGLNCDSGTMPDGICVGPY